MFTYSHVRQGPYGQPVNQDAAGLCVCGCHGHDPRPPAVEARMCQECADERFMAWANFVEITLR